MGLRKARTRSAENGLALRWNLTPRLVDDPSAMRPNELSWELPTTGWSMRRSSVLFSQNRVWRGRGA